MEYMEKYHKISTYVVNMFLSIYEVNQKKKMELWKPHIFGDLLQKGW